MLTITDNHLYYNTVLHNLIDMFYISSGHNETFFKRLNGTIASLNFILNTIELMQFSYGGENCI